jgi:dihydroorotase-like cyclic amidohydrolase
VIGKDADIVAVDTAKTWTVRKDDLFTKNQWSAYEGMSFVGRPMATFLRGTMVYQDGIILGKPQGRRVERYS